jgi:hypothetical protein
VPCDTTTNGARKTCLASSTGLETPASNPRPVQCFRLRARQTVCATAKSVLQIESTFSNHETTGFVSGCRRDGYFVA